MAEKERGLLEAIVGSGEAEEREAEETRGGASDIATVVMMDSVRYDPQLAKKAAHYLDEQATLVGSQIHHFDEERRLAIAAAKRKRFFDHLRRFISETMVDIASHGSIGSFDYNNEIK